MERWWVRSGERGHVLRQLASNVAETLVIPDVREFRERQGELDGGCFRCHDCDYPSRSRRQKDDEEGAFGSDRVGHARRF